ncbi:hypothetical protein P7C70_g400, partial [Phenoliferia sp. Uapishka_3]
MSPPREKNIELASSIVRTPSELDNDGGDAQASGPSSVALEDSIEQLASNGSFMRALEELMESAGREGRDFDQSRHSEDADNRDVREEIVALTSEKEPKKDNEKLSPSIAPRQLSLATLPHTPPVAFVQTTFGSQHLPAPTFTPFLPYSPLLHPIPTSLPNSTVASLPPPWPGQSFASPSDSNKSTPSFGSRSSSGSDTSSSWLRRVLRYRENRRAPPGGGSDESFSCIGDSTWHTHFYGVEDRCYSLDKDVERLEGSRVLMAPQDRRLGSESLSKGPKPLPLPISLGRLPSPPSPPQNTIQVQQLQEIDVRANKQRPPSAQSISNRNSYPIDTVTPTTAQPAPSPAPSSPVHSFDESLNWDLPLFPEADGRIYFPFAHDGDARVGYLDSPTAIGSPVRYEFEWRNRHSAADTN